MRKVRKLSELHRKRISDALKGKERSLEHCKHISEGRKKIFAEGKKIPHTHTEEFKKKQSELKKEFNPMHDPCVVKKMSETLIKNGTFVGENNNNWRGGRPKNRGGGWFKNRKLTLERDSNTCQMCGKTKEDYGKSLTVHHILPYHEGGTNDLSNLITLCMSCHFKVEPRKKRDDRK